MFKLGEFILKNIGKIGKGPSLKEVFKQSSKKSLKSGGKVGKFAKGTAKTVFITSLIEKKYIMTLL